jgi:GcrA cell cycle regulator
MNWTDERVELLRKLWKDGLSCSEVARELGGGITRNGVIGKVHRLGMSGRVKPQAQGPKEKPARKPQPKSSIAIRDFSLSHTGGPRLAPTPLPKEPAVLDPSTNCTLFELRPDSCRWPIGTPGTPQFLFCGAHREHPTPYCTGHANLAYNVRKEQRAKLVATAFDPPDEREAA